jgi:hypothetical protein
VVDFANQIPTRDHQPQGALSTSFPAKNTQWPPPHPPPRCSRREPSRAPALSHGQLRSASQEGQEGAGCRPVLSASPPAERVEQRQLARLRRAQAEHRLQPCRRRCSSTATACSWTPRRTATAFPSTRHSPRSGFASFNSTHALPPIHFLFPHAIAHGQDNPLCLQRELGVSWDVELYGELLKIGGGKERSVDSLVTLCIDLSYCTVHLHLRNSTFSVTDLSYFHSNL